MTEWQKFRQQYKGQGLSMKQLSSIYRSQYGGGLGALPAHHNRGLLGPREEGLRIGLGRIMGRSDYLTQKQRQRDEQMQRIQRMQRPRLHRQPTIAESIAEDDEEQAAEPEIVVLEAPNKGKVTVYDTGACASVDCVASYLERARGLLLRELPSDARPESDLLQGKRFIGIDIRTFSRINRATAWLQSLPDPSDAPNEVYNAIIEMINGTDVGFFYPDQLSNWFSTMLDYGFSDEEVVALTSYIRSTVDTVQRTIVSISRAGQGDMHSILSNIVALNALRIIRNNDSSDVHLVCSKNLCDNVVKLLTGMGYRIISHSTAATDL